MRSIFLLIFFIFVIIYPAGVFSLEDNCGGETSACRKSAVSDDLCSFTATEISDEKWKTLLVGKHLLSLQWIGAEKPGSIVVTDDHGLLRISGAQRDDASGDYLRVDGKIRRAGVKEFTFCGVILTKVSYINGGKECRRSGTYKFAVRGGRKYWRMQEKDNPCDTAEIGPIVDYIDIYIR